MASGKAVAALGLTLILCVFLAACGGGSKAATASAPVIFESSLPSGAVNVPYRATVHVTRGTGTSPFTWSITSGSLPPGLSLDSSSGAITGTPTTIVNATFTVQVTDAKSLTGSKVLSINIRGAVSITPPTLPGGTVGSPYLATLTETGGLPPYTWSVSSGSLPNGLTLTSNSDGTGTISGTPTTLGPYTFTVQVADGETPPATGNSGSLNIYIEGFVTISNTSLPDGNVAIFYDTQLIATGGLAPYTWSLTSGSLPPGLSLTTTSGVISGTPTTTGAYPITVQVVDSESTPATASGMFTITINPTPPLQVTTSSLPAGTQGVRYLNSLAATGGVPPYSWSLTAGPLPAGLTLSGTGIISGTPTGNSGTFPITAQVTDTLGNTASSSGLTLTINSGRLVITTAALPAGTQSVPYSAAMSAAGGTPPYTWSLRFGTLPNGLTLNPSTGVVSGTPTTSGANSVEFQVQDSASPPAIFLSPPFGININPALTNAALTGDYAFSFSGYNNGTPVVAAGRFTADGSGSISNGLLDANRAGAPPVIGLSFTGTYSITADGLGTMTFNTSGPSLVLAVAVDSTGAGMLIQSDPSNPQEYASGAIKRQTIVSLAGGSYAFGSSGVDVAGNRFAGAGAFQLNASGILSKGIIDTNDGGTVPAAAVLGGAYSAPDPSSGRGTASLSINSGAAQNFSYYLVSSGEMIQVSIDQISDTSPLTLTSVLKGNAAGTSFNNLALRGVSIVQTNAVNPNGGSPQAIGVAGSFTGDGTTDGNGFGNATLLFDQNTGGTLAQQQIAGGQYKVNPLNGRVILTGFGGTPPVLYLVNPNQAFLVGSDGNVTSGVLAPQVAGTSGVPLNNVSVLGAYVGGSVLPALPAVTNQVDWLFSDGNGNINVSQDSSGPGGPQTNQFAVTYQVDAAGRALVESNPGGTLQGILFVISPTRIVILSTDTNPVLSTFSIGKAAN
ncbi:MAG: beta strand repeat-containing protein [Terriglobales bacterium]